MALPSLFIVGTDPITGQRYRLFVGGDLEIDGDTLILSSVGSDAKRTVLTFIQNGTIGLLTRLDGSPVMNRAGSIKSVRVFRRTAGAAGTTTVDVNVNGTTVFTDQSFRPVVTAVGGNDQKAAAASIAAPSFAAGDDISVDVDTKETGAPKDLTVSIEVQFT